MFFNTLLFYDPELKHLHYQAGIKTSKNLSSLRILFSLQDLEILSSPSHFICNLFFLAILKSFASVDNSLISGCLPLCPPNSDFFIFFAYSLRNESSLLLNRFYGRDSFPKTDSPMPSLEYLCYTRLVQRIWISLIFPDPSAFFYSNAQQTSYSFAKTTRLLFCHGFFGNFNQYCLPSGTKLFHSIDMMLEDVGVWFSLGFSS